MAKKPAPQKPVVKKLAAKAAPANPSPAYNAAGLTRKGVADMVYSEEYKRRGTPNYPWSDKIKAEMIDRCNGLKTGADIIARIGEIASRGA